MFQYILLALIIVVLISLIYWVFWHNSDDSRRKESERYLRESAGVFDTGARRALRSLAQIVTPIADDYFRHGNVIRYNMLEGNIHGNQRRAAVGHIVRDYAHALTAHAPTDMMVYNIENFNRTLHNNIIDDEIAQLILRFDNIVNTHAPAARQEIIDERRSAAIATTDTRIEAIDKYFDDATKFSDDRQNVHDSKVNNDLRETLNKLKATAGNVNTMAAITEAAEFIETEYTTCAGPNKNNSSAVDRNSINWVNSPAATTANKARAVLQRISQGDTISTFGETEDKIFAYTWERCKHPKNAANEKLMKEAIINALADSIENGTQVCINGRCSRVLNALVTLDFDVEVGSAMTFEAYRNQIFQETKIIINQEISRASASSDPRVVAVGAAYETGETSSDSEAEHKFREEVKLEIDRNIDKYADKLNKVEMDNIKQECYVYATL